MIIVLLSSDWKHTRGCTLGRRLTVNQRDAPSTSPHSVTWGSTSAHTRGKNHSGEEICLIHTAPDQRCAPKLRSVHTDNEFTLNMQQVSLKVVCFLILQSSWNTYQNINVVHMHISKDILLFVSAGVIMMAVVRLSLLVITWKHMYGHTLVSHWTHNESNTLTNSQMSSSSASWRANCLKWTWK